MLYAKITITSAMNLENSEFSLANSTPIKIMIVDDHDIVVDGYVQLLEKDKRYQVVARARDGFEVKSFFEKQRCDLIILDISMPRMNGIETIEFLKLKDPSVKILVVSMLSSPLLTKLAVDKGINGYVFKTSATRILLQAIQEIALGNQYFEKSILTNENTTNTHSLRINGFNINVSMRELEIIKLISLGKSTNEISNQLSISPYTVQTHRKNIYSKLNVSNTGELISLTLRHSIISNF